MAMTLNNDSGVNVGLGTLNKNIAKVGADLRKIASGQRINGAGDGASEFAIGRKMRVLTRALGQDIENSKKGIDLVNTAERGINGIVDELRNLKRMALDSANDHNTDLDRATIQKEFASRMEEIDDIAATTEYNGIYLLDGRWGFHEYVEYKPGKCGCLPTGKNSCTCTTDKTSNLKLDTTVNSIAPAVNTNAILPTALNTKTDESFALNSSNAAPIKLMGAGNNGLLGANSEPVLDISTGIKKNKIDGVFPADNQKESCPYSPPSYARTKGYVPDIDENKTIPVQSKKIMFDEAESGTGLYKLASNDYEPCFYVKTPSSYPGQKDEYYGYYLTDSKYDSYKNDTVYLKKKDKDEYYPVRLKKNAEGYYADSTSGSLNTKAYFMAELTFKNATLEGKPLNLPKDLNNQSISVLCQLCPQFITIKFETNRPAGTAEKFKSDKSYGGYTPVGYAVGIGKDAKTEEEILANIFNGLKKVTGTIPSANYVNLDKDGDQVYLAYDNSTKSYGFYKLQPFPPVFVNGGVGTLSGGGEEEYGGGDTIPGGEDTTPGGQDTTPGGQDTTPGGQDTTPGGQDTTPGGTDTVPGGGDTVPSIRAKCDCLPEMIERFEGNPLVIHTGPKANQRLYVYIKCMKSEAMGLKGIGVETREKALDSLDKLDFALEYALNEATQMGAYQMRLNQTVENLTVRHENTIASESVITDADMAKEVTSYAKHNILAQSAQAMLAQANQKRESILSLLQ